MHKNGGDFSEKDIEEIIALFRFFDEDDSGTIEKTELGKAMNLLGEQVDPPTLAKLFSEADVDQSGKIEFCEFVEMIKRAREDKDQSSKSEGGGESRGEGGEGGDEGGGEGGESRSEGSEGGAAGGSEEGEGRGEEETGGGGRGQGSRAGTDRGSRE